MKKWQIGICVTCAVVLAGMFSSAVAHAAGTTAGAARRGHVEIIDAGQSSTATCSQHGPLFNKLLDSVETEEKHLAARLSAEARAVLLQGMLVIELPGAARPLSYAPADTDAKLISAVEE